MKKIFELIKLSLKDCKKESFLSIFFVAVETTAEVIIPFIMASLIDKGVEVGDFTVIKNTTV